MGEIIQFRRKPLSGFLPEPDPVARELGYSSLECPSLDCSPLIDYAKIGAPPVIPSRRNLAEPFYDDRGPDVA